ncbi:MAG: hypothetical protein ABI036_19415 [Fibrobacteria bacterium]
MDGYGDTLIWRVGPEGYAWHDGKVEHFPQEWDDGMQIPGIPYYWTWGTFNAQKIFHWDGSKTTLLDRPVAEIDGLQFIGNRAVWTERNGDSYVSWYCEGDTPKRLESSYPSNGGATMTAKRLVWLGSDGGPNRAVILRENGQTREILPPSSDRKNMVVTDEMVAWMENGSVMVWRGDSAMRISDATDINTNLYGHGPKLAWYLFEAGGKRPFYFYDGSTVSILKEYPAEFLLRNIIMNDKGMWIQGWLGFDTYHEWFDGTGFRSLGNLGTGLAHLTATHAYGSLFFAALSPHPPGCGDNAVFSNYLMGSDL